MSKCRHKNVSGWFWFPELSDPWIACICDHARKDPAIHDRATCDDCGAWLSLGPSNDQPAEVQAEIRAAELACGPSPVEWPRGHRYTAHWFDDEIRGFSLAETSIQHHTDEYQAGYLARCIAEHKEKP